MKRPLGRLTGALMCSAALTLAAPAAPLFLGEQEIAPGDAGAVQAYCETLTVPEDGTGGETGPVQDEDADENGEMDEAFTDPPMDLGDVAEEEDDGDDDDEDGEGDENGPDLSAISLEDCKAAGLIP